MLKFQNNNVTQINWAGGTDNVLIVKVNNRTRWCHPWTIINEGTQGSISMRTTYTEDPNASAPTSQSMTANASYTRRHLDKITFTATVGSNYQTSTFAWYCNNTYIGGSNQLTYTVDPLTTNLTFSMSATSCTSGSTCSSNNKNSGECTTCTSTGLSGSISCLCASTSTKKALSTGGCTGGMLR